MRHGDRDEDVAGAVAAVEAELRVVFESAERVDAACAALRRAGVSELASSHLMDLRRLAVLAAGRLRSPSHPLIRLLLDVAAAAAAPWTILGALLAARSADVVFATLDLAVTLAASGRLVVDARVVDDLAACHEREGSSLGEPRALETLRTLMLHAPAPAPGADPLVGWLLAAPRGSVRRLVARLLDLRCPVPAPESAARLLGPGADLLAPYLAFTRATHLDLVQLAAAGAPPLLQSVPEAERQLGRALTRDVLAALGWSRVNLGLDVRHVVGVSVDGSPPVIVTPAEATLFDTCAGARHVLDRFVVVAHGGSLDPDVCDAPAVLAAAPGAHIGDATGATEIASPPAANGGDAVARFRAYNLAHAELLARLLDIAPLTADRVSWFLGVMDRIIADFQLLFGQRPGECDGLGDVYGALRTRILRELQGVAGGQPLSAELTRLVQMFEDPRALREVRTLHGLKRYLHQRGLALGFGLVEGGSGTNRTVALAILSPDRVLRTSRRIDYIDFEPASGAGETAVPYAVGILADAFARQLLLCDEQALPAVKVYCYGNEVHYYVLYRNHPAFLRVDYSPPLGGGMIDLQYYGVSKYELGDHPGPSLDAIQTFFRRLDFDVECENTRIHARYDKERAFDLSDICEKAEALLRLLPYLMDVDWVIGQLDLPPRARHDVAEAWADFFARWGTLPIRQLLTEDRRHISLGHAPSLETTREEAWSGAPPYADRFSNRPGLETVRLLNAQVADRTLVEARVPERAENAAQIPLERFLLRPLRLALTRGAVVAGEAGLQPASPDRYRQCGEAAVFAHLLAADDATLEEAARLATLVAALERTLRFETIGSVDGYNVQRADVALRGETPAVYALRDGAGIIRLACFAPDGVLTARRDDSAGTWRESGSTDVAAMAALLRRNNSLPVWVDPGASREPLRAAAIRGVFARPNGRAARRPLPGERVVSGLRASPGWAVGLARLGTSAREPADLAGGVLIAPTLAPADNAFLFTAAGVVSTGGGILSHAGLLAIQFQRPALIVGGRWERSEAGGYVLVYRRLEFTETAAQVDGRHVIERQARRECEDRVLDGDLVELDADAGTLRVLGQGAEALALHDGLQHLRDANRLLAKATADPEVLVQRGRRLRALHQLERLFLRLDDASLARHAVRCLMATGAPGTGEREYAPLLRVLLGNPSVGAGVRSHAHEITRELRLRWMSALEDARRFIPSSSDAGEVLALRVAARRAEDAVRAARRVLEEPPAQAVSQTQGVGAAHVASLLPDRGTTPEPQASVLEGPGAVGSDADETAAEGERIESLALSRLGCLWRVWLEELRTAAHGNLASHRHGLRLLSRLAGVLPVAAAERHAIERLHTMLRRADAVAVGGWQGRRVLWPEDGGLEMQPLVGWKAANLAEVGRLAPAGLVPSWFAVTDCAFREMLDSPVPVRASGANAGAASPGTLGSAIAAVLSRPGVTDAWKSAAIRDLWAETPLPVAVAQDVVAAYRHLATLMPPAEASPGPAPPEDNLPYVAIRSSGREEDAETAIRAGEFDTFLFVRGDEAVLDHLKRAWSGLWTERAIYNRAVFGLPAGGEGGGVVVQRIAWARVSGVLQTINVAEGRPREMVVNVGLGMGEGVVSGAVGADHVVIAKEAEGTQPLTFRYLTCDKRQRVVFDVRTGRGTIRVDTLSHQRWRPALEYMELLEVVEVGARLETAYGFALDIEFCFEGPHLRLLQVRPAPGSLAAWRDTLDRYPFGRLAATAVGLGAQDDGVGLHSEGQS
jgi:pyruvate,water dikinase